MLRSRFTIAILLFGSSAFPALAQPAPNKASLPGDDQLFFDPKSFLGERNNLLGGIGLDDLEIVGALLKLADETKGDFSKATIRIQNLQKKFPKLQDPNYLQNLQERMKNLVDAKKKPAAGNGGESDFPPDKLDFLGKILSREVLTDVSKMLQSGVNPESLEAKPSLNGIKNPPRNHKTTPGHGVAPGRSDRPSNLDDLSTSSPWVRWLQNTFGDSPQWAQFFQEFNAKLANSNGPSSETLKRYETELRDLGHWMARQNFRAPSIRFQPPRLPQANFSMGSMSTPRGLGSVTSSGGSWTGLIVVVFAGLGYAWYRLAKKNWESSKKAQLQNPSRADWSCDPDSVGNPAQFIAAYDKMSLICLGEEARHWNHLRISGGLGQKLPERTADIQSLTALYEKARYESADPPLDDAELARARSGLRNLLEMPGR